ncbi:MAG: hypothetical protein HC828_22345 [Blastochloris sp.]|nr:hypothetical protein [Blastochloris sp.]
MSVEYPITEHGVRADLVMKAQQQVLVQVLPALRDAIENVTNFMYEPDADDEEIHAHLRELATETVIDELVRLLTRDTMPPSKRYSVQDVDGIGIDTLIACHSELMPESARAWFAHTLNLDTQVYETVLKMLPTRMDM